MATIFGMASQVNEIRDEQTVSNAKTDIAEQNGEIISEILLSNLPEKRPLENKFDKVKCKKKKMEKEAEAIFRVDANAMLDLADDCVEPELVSLGVTSYNQKIYEQEIIGQLEKAIDQQTRNDDKSSANEEEVENDEKKSDIVEDDAFEDDDDDDDEIIDDPADRDYCAEREQPDDDADDDDDDVLLANNCDDQQFEDGVPETPFGFRRKKWSNLNVGIVASRKRHRNQIFDDGDIKRFKRRLAQYRLHQASLNWTDGDESYYSICDELRIPQRIWNRLYEHQRECVRWLWGLHVNLCGGIIGDEMGLGKTIQVIAFFIALKCSTYREVCHLYSSLGPVLLVCPATVMHQWVHEFHHWWPTFRVAILHNTGTYAGRDKRPLIAEMVRTGGILITSYNGVCAYHKELIRYSWHYVVLDEGHKIRNPDAAVTHCCKLLETPHRLILSGSPMQNNLRELWSLFDFVYPGKLGSQKTFMDAVAHPIRVGSYCNASHLQIQIAYRCTLNLRNAIKPYLLRRTKEDIRSALTLPAKTEQVLFCRLTDTQRDLYQRYIASGVANDIHRGRTKLFAALIKIRKICNHPFLFSPTKIDGGEDSVTFDGEFFRQSGKMQVVNALLKLWHKQKHKVLLFTQSCQMLDLLERFARLKEFDYMRMDGSTSIGTRQSMIKEFNTDERRFLFLLSTKVGGVGVNLIGANRVIIFDPDWNPCTDIQARERCWRIGQNRDVVIYRLLCAGTVEEKIYHRQIYKQYLTNSVLSNPSHRRFLKVNHIRELFTLNDINQTSLMFAESKVRFSTKKGKRNKSGNKKRNEEEDEEEEETKITKSGTKSENENHQIVKAKKWKIPKKDFKDGDDDESSPESVDSVIEMPEISEERRQELRERAKALSRMMSQMFAKEKSERKQAGETIDQITTATTPTTDIVKIKQTNAQKVEAEDKEEKVSKKKNSNLRVKKPKEGIKFEGKRIKHLVAQQAYESDEEDDKYKNTKVEKKTRDNRGDQSNAKEDYILRNLLGSTLDVVLRHDRIENVNIPDHYHLEQEAQRIANEAIDSLRENRRFSSSSANVSFTRNLSDGGEARSSSSSSSSSSNNQSDQNPLSSANLLAALKAKRTVSVANKVNNGSRSARTNNARTLDNEEMLRQLRDFVHRKAAQPNEARTDEIMKYFDGKLAPEKCYIFKAMIRALCEKIRAESGEVRWRLKPDFRFVA